MSADLIEKIASDMAAEAALNETIHEEISPYTVRRWVERLRALPSAELERDAGRYRTIRECLEGDVEELPQWLYDALHCSGDPEEFDAKIDAARAKEAKR